jgi:phytoene dehydrogenase-like protein
LYREIRTTSDSLGNDGAAYTKLYEPLTRDWNKLAREFLQPIIHLPRSPIALAKFGIRAVCPATILGRLLFKAEPARALFAGIAAHSFLSLASPVSSAFALVLGAAGHAVGWPSVRGGSQALSKALAQYLQQLGGKIETNRAVKTLDDLPRSCATLFDLSTWQFARIAQDRLPGGYLSRLRRFRHAPGVFKIDYALNAPIPWRAKQCHHAGTVHAVGSFEEVATAEEESAAGKIPDRPFVLVAQQSLFDGTRAPHGKHTLWAYCHVPSGCQVDVADRIETQIERFAPGFRDCIIARHKSGPADLERSNANLVAGDISGGAATVWQLLARPILSPTPYRTPIRGIYLCSGSTPPGGGVHGMCGYHAARAALRDHFGQRLAA